MLPAATRTDAGTDERDTVVHDNDTDRAGDEHNDQFGDDTHDNHFDDDRFDNELATNDFLAGTDPAKRHLLSVRGCLLSGRGHYRLSAGPWLVLSWRN